MDEAKFAKIASRITDNAHARISRWCDECGDDVNGMYDLLAAIGVGVATFAKLFSELEGAGTEYVMASSAVLANWIRENEEPEVTIQ
jgi:hypothetical protein